MLDCVDALSYLGRGPLFRFDGGILAVWWNAVFWLYGGIVMFSGYRISKMKSHFVIVLLEFAVVAVSVGLYIKTTWPLD